jgi:hypothetical protein
VEQTAAEQSALRDRLRGLGRLHAVDAS